MVSGHGYSAKGSEIIMIIAFIAGLVIVFYMLAKREAGKVLDDVGKSLSDVGQTVKTVVENIGAPPGYHYDAERGEYLSNVTIKSALPQENLPIGYQPSGYSPGGIAWAFDFPSEPYEVKPIEGERPTNKYYKVSEGKWYLLYGCDASGYNCKSSKEATIWDRINLGAVWDSIPETR